MKCPCNPQNLYVNCCQPLLQYKQLPSSAEALMRSRYTAYALNNIDYIVKTMRGLPLKGFSKSNTLISNKETTWLSLTVLKSTETTVHFIAAYLDENGERVEVQENSLFKKKMNQWFYVGHDALSAHTPKKNSL